MLCILLVLLLPILVTELIFFRVVIADLKVRVLKSEALSLPQEFELSCELIIIGVEVSMQLKLSLILVLEHQVLLVKLFSFMQRITSSDIKLKVLDLLDRFTHLIKIENISVLWFTDSDGIG